MAVEIQIDAGSAAAKLTALPDKVRVGVRQVVQAGALKLLAKAQQKVSGDVLQVRSGALLNSLRETGLSDSGDTLSDGVSTDAALKYAHIQEYGGRIEIPEIVPVNARALAFEYGGKVVFAMKTVAHVVEIPEHSFMRSSLAEIAPAILDDIRKVVASAANE
jgi:phage gpG-like protein